MLSNIAKTIALSILFLSIIIASTLLLSEASYAADYTDAMSHAQNAFLIQSGLQGMEDGTKNYLKSTYLNPVVDQYGWTRTLGLVGASAWWVYKHRNIPIPLTHNCKLTLSTTSLGLEYHFK